MLIAIKLCPKPWPRIIPDAISLIALELYIETDRF